MIRIGIANKIRKLRKERGWTQNTLAQKAGLHQVSIAQIENRRRPTPALETRKKLAKAFNVDIIELLD